MVGDFLTKFNKKCLQNSIFIVIFAKKLKAMKTKKKTKNFNFQEDARRKQEIEMYGKMLSLRPSVCHKSKKLYDRKNNKKEISRQMDISFIFNNIFI